MTVTLPDTLRSTLEREATTGGFRSVDDYVAHLVSPTGEPAFRTRAELAALLDAGMASGVAGVVDDAFWVRLDTRIRDRAA